MRRFFSISFITLALFVSAAGAAPAAHAGLLPDGNACSQGSSWVADHNQCEYGDGSVGKLVTENEAVAQEADATASRIANDKAAAKAGTDYKAGDTDSAYNGIMQKIMSLFAWLVGVAAIVLDNAVYYTVVIMGTYVNKLSAIGVTWRILRDIGNIMLIFGFLAVGITTILNVEWYGGGKKMLPMMLVAAVFLNFSLFISEAVIDTGNLFATQFYTQINGGKPAGDKNFDLASVANEGISNKIMGQLGMQTIYGEATKPDTKIFEGANSWFIGFMGIILFLITAFVLFSLAFVLIARFVILIFIIILAPIGFAGLAVPQLAARAKKWWDTLFQQTVTAPILMLMLYIALAVITDANFLTGFCVPSAGATSTTCEPNWLGFVTGNSSNYPGFASMMLSFLVAMGLLLLVVIQSKNLSAFGAAGATKLAGKLTFGLTGAGLRTTAGFGSQYLARKLRSSKLGRVPIVGRSLAGVLDRGAKASWDIRGAKIGGGLGALGIDAGKAQEGGYAKREKEAIEGRENYAKTLTGKEQSMKERAAIAGAEAGRKEAEDKETAAKNERAAAAQAAAGPAAEVARLQAIVDDNRNKGILDPKSINDLKAAQQNSVASQADLNAAEDKLKQATKDLADKRAAEAKTKSDILARTGSAAAAQQAYAENIVWGPGQILFRNRKASQNIIRYAGKSDDQRQLDALVAVMAKAAKESGGTTSAPSTGAASATGGVAGK